MLNKKQEWKKVDDLMCASKNSSNNKGCSLIVAVRDREKKKRVKQN